MASATPSSTRPRLVQNLQPPYYAVIFTSQRTPGENGYGAMADRMVALAAQQPGFLGVESARDAEGLGITVSYWESEDAIRDWRRHAEHLEAQRRGRNEWYAAFQLRVCRVEREHGMASASPSPTS